VEETGVPGENHQFIDKTKVITAALGSTITLNCTTVEGQAASWTHKSDRTCYTSTNNGSIINIEHLSPVDLVAVSFIGGGNRSTRRKPPSYSKSLTNFIT
jgi:hypothetical protein